MRHDASEQAPGPGDLVVVEGEAGVWRVERIVTVDGESRLRCFSYVDGNIVVVPRPVVRRCPDLTRAAP